MVKYTVIFAGWIFLCNGVIDMIYLILLRKGLKEIKQDVEAVDADGEIISGEDSGETDDLDTEASVQPEEPIAPEPEYAPWSSRKKKNPQKRIFLDLLKKKRKIMPLLARKISAQKKLTEKFLKWKNPWMMYRQTKMIRQWMG